MMGLDLHGLGSGSLTLDNVTFSVAMKMASFTFRNGWQDRRIDYYRLDFHRQHS